MTISDATLGAGFDALPGQAAVLDRSGRILATNRAWREFGAASGVDRDHVGQNYLTVCDASNDEEAVRTGEAIRSLVEGEREAVSVEYPCHSPDRRRWFTMRAVTFVHDAESYVLVHHHEVTERKRAELELAAQNDRLETVTSVLSHDLRNPLNVALGRAELLDGEDAEILVRSLERMEAIVEDALVLAADDPVGDARTVELDACAESAWQQVETGDAALSVAESAAFSADSSLLAHVFENLFRNAVEHGATTVTVGAFEGGFYVEDDGPGVPSADRDAVFEANYSTTADGTGLGLAIVKQVVDAHGWSVRVTESVGDGDEGRPRKVQSDGGPETSASGPNRGARFEVSF
ncbi:PAS domain-containing sensor histidine kinase [Halorussus limi]|uniref:histidine kinase n=1 Tax=Halorussus limi TaxID=2938695 RepID=A0A8U0HQQ3_9EURY|nr:PAS domain-containing sensor histidine kinase [Halorussus limi]UPV73227.1 PAS domain-containing sensor histidine kinase [Halorussus limi]